MANEMWNGNFVIGSTGVAGMDRPVCMSKKSNINRLLRQMPQQISLIVYVTCAMLHRLISGNVTMPVGESGRIVIEVDTRLKRDLYSVLDRDGLTLKEWFIGRASHYVEDAVQPSLAFAAEKEPKESQS